MKNLSSTLTISELKFVIEEAFNIDFYKLFVQKKPLNSSQQKLFDFIIEKYKQGKPLEYILKKSSFFGLDLEINDNVFIPRKETEILAEEVLKFTEGKEYLLILDIGTGSANIPISIALKRPSFKIFSVDISKEALEVAKKNISKYKLENIFLINSDLLSCFKKKRFDIIVSNPPYVESSYIENSKTLKFEPQIALDGGKDGLRFIKRLLNKVPFYLKKEGLLFLEIGYNQKEKVLNYALSMDLKLVSLIKDYSGIERVLVFEKTHSTSKVGKRLKRLWIS